MKELIVSKIEHRIRFLFEMIGKQMNAIDYSKLSEDEKIPLRILQAEKLAYQEYLKGIDLDAWLEDSILKEHYCGAQGIKNAVEFISTLV